mmetsp:Transcript_8149/g.25136  ORF Transcript_8149/g.25136 Transcript_8149/m.25136 type:complete len:255 (+) Transcript_8149:2361-3125(+)
MPRRSLTSSAQSRTTSSLWGRASTPSTSGKPRSTPSTPKTSRTPRTSTPALMESGNGLLFARASSALITLPATARKADGPTTKIPRPSPFLSPSGARSTPTVAATSTKTPRGNGSTSATPTTCPTPTGPSTTRTRAPLPWYRAPTPRAIGPLATTPIPAPSSGPSSLTTHRPDLARVSRSTRLICRVHLSCPVLSIFLPPSLLPREPRSSASRETRLTLPTRCRLIGGSVVHTCVSTAKVRGSCVSVRTPLPTL